MGAGGKLSRSCLFRPSWKSSNGNDVVVDVMDVTEVTSVDVTEVTAADVTEVTAVDVTEAIEAEGRWVAPTAPPIADAAVKVFAF